MSRPLVSVCTGTWQRHELLLETIQNVRGQSYRPLEHLIVSDGRDPVLADLLASEREDRESCAHEILPFSSDVPIRFIELGRNWTTYLPNSRNAAPMIVAQLLAAGEYLCWLADDERMTPDHVASLVDLLESSGADFVYPKVRMWWKGTSPEQGWDIGTDPPQYGQITHVLYRATLLEQGLTRLGAGGSADWNQIDAWMRHGARWAHLPRVTFTHRADA